MSTTETQNVYVISEGERGEGGTPIAAVRTLQVARQYIYDRFGTWAEPQDERGHWMARRRLDSPVDEVHIHRLRIGARP